MTAQAVGYIRRSHADTGGEVSRDDQERTLRELADRYGEPIERTFIDWGRSGGDSDDDGDALKHRPQFTAMLRRIEAGDVSAVFALKVDRLGRSTYALGRLWAACRATGTKVITTEGDLTDGDDPATFLMRHTFEGFAVYYLKDQKRKSAKVKAFTDRRKDQYGLAPAFYEKRTPKKHGTERVEMVLVDPEGLQTVIGAYEAAGGNAMRTATALNEAHVPPPRPVWAARHGHTPRWYGTTVRRVIRRHAPDKLAEVKERRARTVRPRLFRGLLRCPCGATLCPSGSEANRSIGYYCPQGHHDKSHPRPYYVSEPKVLAWARVEAARLRTPGAVLVDTGDDYDDSAKRAALELVRDTLGEAAYGAAVATLDAEAEAHGKHILERQTVPAGVDWGAPAPSTHEALSALWERINLGSDLLPVSAVWRVSEWRADDQLDEAPTG